MNRFVRFLPPALAVAVFAAGCSTFDAERARADQTAALSDELARREAEALSRPLDLGDCVRLALTNGCEARLAALDRELGRVRRDTAFSAFLPRVSSSVGYATISDMPQGYPDNAGMASIKGGIPIFAPATWFLYAQARHGKVAAEIAESYTRQAIALKTTSAFYDVLVQEDLVAAYAAQALAASNTADRAAGLAREGLARPWEADRAAALLAQRTAQRDAAGRELARLRGVLAQQIGLSPLAPLRLSRVESPLPPLEGSVTNRILTALSVHPELSIADRQVVIREHKVREAFCAFLPQVTLFAQQNFFDLDLAMIPDDQHLWGVSGAWDLFSGFQNLSNYKAAKIERGRSEIERERTFLSVMVRVIAADNAVRDAAQAAEVARIAHSAAASRADDLAARAQEGLESLDKALDAEAERDLAQVDLVRSSYVERVARANLALAMGVFDTETARTSANLDR